MAEVIVIHGYPGSGKTTQCERLVAEGMNEATFAHISIGNQLRAIKNGQVDSLFSAYLTSAEATSPPPDDIVNGIIFEAIKKSTETDVLLVDGYPRFAHAVDEFHQTLRETHHTLRGTIELTASLEMCMQRAATRPRRDDEPESDDIYSSLIAYRYTRHEHTTRLALLALSTLAPVETVDAGGKTDDTYARFRTAIARLALRSDGNTSSLFDKA